MSQAGESLPQTEIDQMAFSAKMMTLECGMRFLTDYLNGDTYFKTAYPEHNLVRARNQFALVADMERKMDQMEALIAELFIEIALYMGGSLVGAPPFFSEGFLC